VTLAETTAKIAALPLAYQPGDVWEYSAATDVLGRVIEVASGMELDQYLYERVTKPLGMSATGFWVHEADRGRLAEPQVVAATGKRPPAMFDATQKPKFMSGGGGMVSTVADYWRFAEMLRARRRTGQHAVVIAGHDRADDLQCAEARYRIRPHDPSLLR
jgi:CubicO group peptidase (beta-lactamase class C family)